MLPPRRGLFGQLHRLAEGDLFDGGQLLQGAKAEGAQEIRRRFILNRTSRNVQTSRLLDELFVQQRRHGIGAVHAADLLHHGLRRRLVVGDDGQGFQLGGRQLGRLSCFQRLRHIVRHFSGGYHLVALFQFENADSPALKGVFVRQIVGCLFHIRRIRFQRGGESSDIDTLARGKENGLNGTLQLFRFHQVISSLGCLSSRRTLGFSPPGSSSSVTEFVLHKSRMARNVATTSERLRLPRNRFFNRSTPRSSS